MEILIFFPVFLTLTILTDCLNDAMSSWDIQKVIVASDLTSFENQSLCMITLLIWRKKKSFNNEDVQTTIISL
jgi:hypothetical protein